MLDETATLLVIMSIGVLVLTMVQTMTGILQGLGRVLIPVRNLAIGAVVKIVLSVVLIRIPDINVKGAAFGTVACYAIAAILNVISVVKHTKMKLDLSGQFLKPLFCTGLMVGVVWILLPTFVDFVGDSLATLGVIAVGGVVYVAALITTQTISKDEIAMIRGKASE